MPILMTDWEYVNIEELTTERDLRIGHDASAPVDSKLFVEHAGGIELEADQYIVCVEGGDVKWEDDFDDLIKTRK